MRTLTGCPLCEHGRSDRLHELARISGSAHGLASLEGRGACFMICKACGFVFQNPTLDEAELSKLYQGEYRTYEPPADYLDCQERLGRKLCDWIESVLPTSLPTRRVLDIGCGAGCFLAEFARRGWNVVGIDGSQRWTEWGRRRFGLDLRAGMFSAEGLPGEQFSLVMFSHVIEHLPDPLPTLRAIRRCLEPGGALFVGAPNILLPPVGTRLQDNFMGGPHVCLYSPRTIVRVLAKAGFQVLVQDNWLPRGLRVIAIPSETPYRLGDYARDDWRVINHLYGGLIPGYRGGCFGVNLAALLPRYWQVLDELAKAHPGLAARIQQEGGQVVNLRMSTPSGEFPLLALGGEVAGNHECEVPERGLVVLSGLAFGRHAMSLLPVLERRDAKLVVWERDLSVVRTAMTVRDLRPLLRSPRVHLSGGAQLRMTSRIKRWFTTASRIIWQTDPQMHERVRTNLYAPAERAMQARAHQFVHDATSSCTEKQLV